MSKIQTTKTICDRCGRDAEQADQEPVTLTALGEEITYEDLCDRCRGVCRDYLRKIAKLDPLRKRAAKEEG